MDAKDDKTRLLLLQPLWLMRWQLLGMYIAHVGAKRKGLL